MNEMLKKLLDSIKDKYFYPNKWKYRDEKCIMDKILEEEKEKPIHLRRKMFHVSCPCRKCSIHL